MPKTLLKYFVLLAFAFMSYGHTTAAQVAVGVSINVAPPELPEYDQPECPGDGYIWTPGYWAYGDDDYYWVPGTWVEAPEVGYLWTPPYWGWGGSGYIFHEGYWGTEVGFYGGISYGFGYFGNGYEGGRWDRGHFYYNTTVNRVNVTIIHNTYNTRIENRNVTRVSYNGGNGGISRRPDAREEKADREQHRAPVAAQTQHFQEARSNRDLRASVNHGKPAVAATAKPGDFHGNVAPARTAGVVHESAGHPAANNNAGRENNNAPAANRTDRPNYSHAKEVQHETRQPVTPSGNAKQDQKFQQQQQKLDAKQTQEHQKLAQKQEADHARLDQKKANDVARQRVETQHQQQTQKLEQRHTQQQTRVQQHAPAPRPAQHEAPAPRKP